MITITNINLSKFSLIVNNIGGIQDLEMEILPGLNIIEEPNASGKTSFLRSLILSVAPTGTGSEFKHILRAHENEGFVKVIDSDKQQFTRVITRNNGTVTIDGDNIIDPQYSALVRKFAIGGTDNEILTAVRTGKPLKQLLLEDTNIDTLIEKRNNYSKVYDQLKEDLKALKNEKTKLISHKTNLSKYKSDFQRLVEEKKKLDGKRNVYLSKHESTPDNQILNNKLDDLSNQLIEKKRLVSGFEHAIQKSKESINNNKKSIEANKNQLNKLTNTKTMNIDDIQQTIESKKRKYEQLEAKKEMLAEMVKVIKNQLKSPIELDDKKMDDMSIDTLVDKKTTTCMMCGKTTDIESIRLQSEALTAYNKSILAKHNVLNNEIKELQSQIKRIRDNRTQIKSLETQINSLVRNIKDTENRIEMDKKSLKRANAEFNQLEKERNEITSKIDSELNVLTMDLSNKNEKIGIYKEKIQKLESDIESIEQRIKTSGNIETDLKTAKANYEKSASEIHNVERRILNEFNQSIDKVYTALNFKSNIERVFLNAQYELEIVRTGKSSIDSDSIKTLSTSELEVIGIVVMLSGYIANDMKEYFPLFVMDELTYLDDNRLKSLTKYIEQTVDCFVLTKLPGRELNNDK